MRPGRRSSPSPRAYQRQASRAAAQKAVDELEEFLGTYDPAIVELHGDELARIRK